MESRNLNLLANSVYFTSLLDTFGWRGEVGSISVVSIRMNKSSMTTISLDLGRWRPYKLSEACSTHVGHMRLRCYYDNRCTSTLVESGQELAERAEQTSGGKAKF